MAKGDIKYLVTVDTKKGKVAVKEFDQKVDKLGKTSKTAAGGFKTLAAKVAVGVAAFYAASKALKGVIRWMGDAVDKAAIQQTAEKEVAAALESTGREVGKNTKHFKEYASELQKATIYGDEQILSAQALMIQLTKLDREGIDAATKGAIGLASVYKTDLQAATTLVGKALAGNFSALSRYGISVERTATAEEKRISLLEQLQVMYKRAEADTETYAGQVKQLGNVYGDLKEFVAAAVIENEAVLDVITRVKEAMIDFVEKAKVGKQVENYKKLTGAIGGWTTFAEKAARIIVRQTGDWGSYQDVLGKLNDLWYEHGEVTHETVIALAEGKEGFKGLQEWIWLTYGGYLKAVEAAQPLKDAIKETTELIETQVTVVGGIRGELTLWGQELIDLTDILKNATAGFYELGVTALPAARNVSDALGLAVSSFKDATVKTEKYYSDLGETSQAFYMDVAMSAAEGFTAILSTLRQWAIAEAVKYIFAKVPFPASLIIAALAARAIGAFFNTIKSMETGGTIEREGIYHLHPGETVVPARQTTNIYNQSASQGIRRIIIQNRIVIGEQTFYRESVKNINKAGQLGDLVVPNKVVV